MAEQKTNMTDEQLAQELRKSKGGKLGGKILSLLGGVIAVAGMILGGNLVLVVIGGVVLGLGQMVQGKSKEQAGRQTFDSIAPDIVGTAFENVQMNPVPPLLDANDTNIPLPRHTHCSGSGYVRGTYRGLTTELCTVRLTEVNEVQREATGLWEKNEQPVYTGQWMLCELGQKFPTWLTIWPRDRLDKLFSSVRKKPPSCCCIRAFFFVWAGFATNRNSATPGNAKAQTKMGSCCINIEIHPAITSKTPSDMLMLSVL